MTNSGVIKLGPLKTFVRNSHVWNLRWKLGKKPKKTFSVDFDLAARMDWDAGWIAQRDLATGTVVRKSNDWRMMNADSARIKFFAEAKKLTEEDLEATRRWLEI